MADFKVDDDGDLVLSRGELDTTDDDAEAAKQNLMFRLRTGLFDYQPEPQLGAGLDEFIGRPNREDVAASIRRAIIRAITYDGTFAMNSIAVEIVPLSQHVIGVYIFHQPRFSSTSTPVLVTATINMNSGLITLLDGNIR